jgi:chloramphenicol-sensitive protein RarD
VGVKSDSRQAKIGVAYGLAAFIWWGGCVFYFKAVAHVSPDEVLAHRIIWSALLLIALLTVQGRLRSALVSMKSRKKILAISCTTVIISINWYVFIWAVGHDQVLQTSLGYYINPLLNVLLGFTFLRERYGRLQWTAIFLAAVGVAIVWIDKGRLPIVALALPLTFSLYGLIRKTTHVEGVVGLAVETACIAPAALFYLWYLEQNASLVFAHADRATDVLLFSAGIITALPMVWFVNAAQRLRYATVGLMQYVAPTLTFLIAVFVFREPFGVVDLVSFALIWVALTMYGFASFNEGADEELC